MTTTEDLAVAAPATAPSTLARVSAPPKMLHHLAHVTHDVEATVDFYTRIMGMPLVSAVIDDQVPSTGDPFPYVHLFFELADGSTIAFFESLDLPPEAPAPHPAYDIFNHLAMEAGSKEEVDRWAEHLRAEGVEVVGPIDHSIIYSVYFYDPNGLRLELTTTIVDTWKEHGAEAAADIDEWIRLKKETGGSSEAAIAWILERRAKHKSLPLND